MTAPTTLTRTWPMLSALGGGLVLLALAAGAGGAAAGALAVAGIAGLSWGVLSLRVGRAIVPAVALGVSTAVLVGAGALVGTGLAVATGVAVGPLVAASVFISVVAGHTAYVVRRRSRAARATADSRSRGSWWARCSSRDSPRRRSLQPRRASSPCRTGSTGSRAAPR